MLIKSLGLTDYRETHEAMKAFTQQRDDTTEDELWLTQHHPVYTLGQAGKTEHLLQQTEIPLIQSDRGGQITYHGPGQAVVYLLINLKRQHIGVRQFVELIESGVIEYLAALGVNAVNDPQAPGVYVEGQKIASLGIRIRGGCSYHGVALNVDNDLSPFNAINPCGYSRLKVISCQSLGLSVSVDDALAALAQIYQKRITAL